MSLSAYVVLALVFAVATFFIANAQKARSMTLAQILEFAVKAKATAVRLRVGEPVELETPSGIRTLFGSTLKAADYERLVLSQLSETAREDFRAGGRCQWRFDEAKIGKIVAEVETQNARLVLPTKPRQA